MLTLLLKKDHFPTKLIQKHPVYIKGEPMNWNLEVMLRVTQPIFYIRVISISYFYFIYLLHYFAYPADKMFWKIHTRHRNNRSQLFFKIGVLKKISNFTGKHLCWSLFDNVAGPQASNFIRKSLKHRCFHLKVSKFLKTPFLQNTLGRMPLQTSRLTFFQKEVFQQWIVVVPDMLAQQLQILQKLLTTAG